ncbi:MAG: hypothetical protein P0S95_07500 [Rhabdochlamydiaceae bacterium]|nr:hypothetical protein [Candidatus Amphrikana amoebophyrae]
MTPVGKSLRTESPSELQQPDKEMEAIRAKSAQIARNIIPSKASTPRNCSSVAISPTSITTGVLPVSDKIAKMVRETFPTPVHMFRFAESNPIDPNLLAQLLFIGFYGPGGETTCWKFHETLEDMTPKLAQLTIIKSMPFHMPEKMRGSLIRQYFDSPAQLVDTLLEFKINIMNAIPFLFNAHLKGDAIWEYGVEQYSDLLTKADTRYYAQKKATKARIKPLAVTPCSSTVIIDNSKPKTSTLTADRSKRQAALQASIANYSLEEDDSSAISDFGGIAMSEFHQKSDPSSWCLIL